MSHKDRDVGRYIDIWFAYERTNDISSFSISWAPSLYTNSSSYSPFWYHSHDCLNPGDNYWHHEAPYSVKGLPIVVQYALVSDMSILKIKLFFYKDILCQEPWTGHRSIISKYPLYINQHTETQSSNQICGHRAKVQFASDSECRHQPECKIVPPIAA